jgi:radical SAM superfamily enzyme YgiQ (UPF0313 family)
MMAALDALFVHVPRFRGHRREIMVLPLGLPALANFLADHGRSVEIWHLGIESEIKVDGQPFALRQALNGAAPPIVLFSLHWNQQTRPVLGMARRIKQWLPDTKVVLGGLTASVFARELAQLDFIDAIIQGDGEIPLKRLLDLWLDGQGRASHIPNLVTTASGDAPRPTWLVDARLAGRLRHGDLSLLRNYETYVGRPLYADFSEGTADGAGYGHAAYLNGGRGCGHGCVCCGGAASAQWLTTGRQGILRYPLAKLARDLREAEDCGARVVRTSFDPPAARPHLARWFRQARAEGHRFRLIYDLWALPQRRYLETLASCFEHVPPSLVVYSPECGSETVRARIRPPGFSNDALVASVRQAESLGLATHVFFSAGLPGEGPDELEQTLRLADRLRRETGAAISAAPMAVDPASPLWSEPERFGVSLLRRSLQDFYHAMGISEGPGYETEQFDEAAIVQACQRIAPSQ